MQNSKSSLGWIISGTLILMVTTKLTAQSDNLQKIIEAQDSIFFTAYNNCNIELQASMLADSIEFYHDKGGLSTSKKDILTATRNNICGKVTRELVAGSIEVSPVPGYGAIEIGMHKFHNNQEPDQPSYPSKFVVVWRFRDKQWTMTRVISLHK